MYQISAELVDWGLSYSPCTPAFGLCAWMHAQHFFLNWGLHLCPEADQCTKFQPNLVDWGLSYSRCMLAFGLCACVHAPNFFLKLEPSSMFYSWSVYQISAELVDWGLSYSLCTLAFGLCAWVHAQHFFFTGAFIYVLKLISVPKFRLNWLIGGWATVCAR